MKVLLLAPHPFYQERGTPIAVDLVLRVLSGLGHTVDVLTYHLGADRTYPGVTLHRIPAVRGVHNLRPGLSAGKLLCDVYFWRSMWGLVDRSRYDLLHAGEEAVFMARAVRRRRGIPYLYDMDSSMANQIVEKKPLLRPLLPVLRRIERGAVRDARLVLPVCESLARLARTDGARDVQVLEDISLLSLPDAAAKDHVDPDLPVAGPGVVFGYIGNLERYQGIDLMLRAFSQAAGARPELRLLVVGGRPDDIERYRSMATALGCAARTFFAGPRPPAQLGAVLRRCNVVVSPRIKGGNTPMKIYSYMDSGRPLLATRLDTHTQVLDDSTAMLVDPTPEAMAAGMRALADDPDLRTRLASAARALVAREYSFDAYRRKLTAVYARLATPAPDRL